MRAFIMELDFVELLQIHIPMLPNSLNYAKCCRHPAGWKTCEIRMTKPYRYYAGLRT